MQTVIEDADVSVTNDRNRASIPQNTSSGRISSESRGSTSARRASTRVLAGAAAGTGLVLDKVKKRMSTMTPFSSRDVGSASLGPPPDPLETPWLVEEFGPAFGVSSDGKTLTHMRKGFDVAIGDRVMRKGVHRITFIVHKSRNGKGHNLYVGVADANAQRVPPAQADGGVSTRGGATARSGAPYKMTPGSMGKAWGLHPFDGTVYFSEDGYQRGEKAWLPKAKEVSTLTVQQVAQLQHAHSRGKADGTVIVAIVNMDDKTLSFSVNDGPEIDSKVVLPEAVSPYVFFDWKDDAVSITAGVDSALRQPAILKEPGSSDAKTKSMKDLGTAATIVASMKVGSSDRSRGSPDRGSNRKTGGSGGGSADARLQRAATLLMLVHQRDASMLPLTIPGISPEACNDRQALLAELDRLGEQIDTMLAEDVRA